VWLVLACALLVFAEDAVFVGFVVPGETAAVVAGVATALRGIPLWVAIVAVDVAAIAGDTVGYEVGRHALSRVLDAKPLRRHRGRVERARDVLRRRGGVAVFLGRFTAFFRAVMPALAGMSKMHYPRFLAWNAAGGIVWGTGYVVLGHVAGASYQQLESKVGHGAAYAIGGLVVLGIIVWRVRAHRRERT
jgi:membrane protein DedA with SNARE-associated domain